VEIERFVWTDHAELRFGERGLTRPDIEQVVREGHSSREVNRGDANWRVYGTRSDGQQFAVIYDHPAMGDAAVARIVSIWLVRNSSRS
jgi:hypothetical protein